MPVKLSLNCRGHRLTLDRPRVMGILNLTPDSFSDGGQYHKADRALARVEQMLLEGADLIDIGGYSSRPGAADISAAEELSRIAEISSAIMDRFPETLISVDTFRAEVAKEMLDRGVHLINDISAGELDPDMISTVASYAQVPYIMMHMQGRPQTMQDQPDYQDVREAVWDFFVAKIQAAQQAGVKELILDPGFGFGKTQLHNFQLFGELERYLLLRKPLLIGISRKSMLYRFFDLSPQEVLPAATALHFQALIQGVHLLRVHDVEEAVRIVKLFTYMREHGIV